MVGVDESPGRGWVRRKGLSLDANLYDQQDPHLQSIVLPKGSIASRRLQVVMNEERIERLSCPLYRRGSMMICLTAHSSSGDCRCFGPRDNAVSRGGNISSREIMWRQSKTRLVASRRSCGFQEEQRFFDSSRL